MLPPVARTAQLDMLTDDFPPYSFAENGRISGICMDMVHAALKDHPYTLTIQLFPFARAYATTRDGKNIFEFCVARTPEREDLFHWIGPVGPTAEGLLSLASRKDIRLTEARDMAAFQIGTVIEDVVDQYLTARQEAMGLQLQRVSTYRQNMRKLMAGRIDLWAGNLIVGFQLARELGYDPSLLRAVHFFPELDSDYYLVTGKKSDPILVEELTKIFDAFVVSGHYGRMAEAFRQNWTFHPHLFFQEP
jgi:polar amino acid transport system substrate-binding protein